MELKGSKTEKNLFLNKSEIENINRSNITLYKK